MIYIHFCMQIQNLIRM